MMNRTRSRGAAEFVRRECISDSQALSSTASSLVVVRIGGDEPASPFWPATFSASAPPRLCLSLILFGIASLLPVKAADDFQQKLQPIRQHCVGRHGGEKVKGKVNLKEIANAGQFLAKPELIKEIIDVIDAGDMPPEDEAQVSQPTNLRCSLRSRRCCKPPCHRAACRKRNPPRRLNRFQYNNAVRDLFQLNRDVFALSEKLMTRETIYLNAPKMPSGSTPVRWRCILLAAWASWKPFPQDLSFPRV